MEFKEYQKQAHTTALYSESIKTILGIDPNNEITQQEGTIIKLFNISYVGLGLGEVGEIQNKLKKILRDSYGNITQETKDFVSKELGDVLWYVAEMCSVFNLDMNDVAQQNIDKLFSRKDRGVIQGSGDNR